MKIALICVAAFGVGWCVGGLGTLLVLSLCRAAKSHNIERRAVDLSHALRAGDPADIVLTAQLLDDEVAQAEGAQR
jgi:hypothetical protein